MFQVCARREGAAGWVLFESATRSYRSGASELQVGQETEGVKLGEIADLRGSFRILLSMWSVLLFIR